MAKTRTDHTKLAFQRLALDEEVQEHLGNAVVQLREAWRRAAHRPPARAVEDKQLYARIRQAAISLARAAGAARYLSPSRPSTAGASWSQPCSSPAAPPRS